MGSDVYGDGVEKGLGRLFRSGEPRTSRWHRRTHAL